jgi:ABC-type lipoprotein export system ATPase subunit
MSMVLHANQLAFRFPSGPVMTFPDVAVEEGRNLLIIGKSGSGKTTLLHLLAWLRKPMTGHVEIAGLRSDKVSGSTADKHRGRHAGMVFQTPHFVQSLTVRDNLKLPGFFSGTPFETGRVNELLERVNIAHKANSLPSRLSIGEQQRLGIARALVHRPSVVFADEPTSALDDENTERVLTLLSDTAAESGSALVVVTHDQRLKDRFTNILSL